MKRMQLWYARLIKFLVNSIHIYGFKSIYAMCVDQAFFNFD